jgi:hypothetical protein
LGSGYRRYIRVRHANGYQAAYGHMSAFARNIAEGQQVRQNQIIGYVGSTGLSTGTLPTRSSSTAGMSTDEASAAAAWCSRRGVGRFRRARTARA